MQNYSIKLKKITGTFLDEITHDIPAQNWGKKEWADDFDAMKNIGIDTVILIRAGYKDRCVFDSQVLSQAANNRGGRMLPAEFDLLELYLKLASERKMKFFFGTYDSGDYWMKGDYDKEISLNKKFCDEVISKYGHYEAFQGWYLCHEINAFNAGMMNVYRSLSAHLKQLKKAPILISPYIRGSKQFGEGAISFEAHLEEWKRVFGELSGIVDIAAFQDGQISYQDLPRYLSANTQLARENGIESWSNIETFDRDMPIKFPPADWRNILYKIRSASEANVDKLITFEFSHFMSPNSSYISARHLFNRYSEEVLMK